MKFFKGIRFFQISCILFLAGTFVAGCGDKKVVIEPKPPRQEIKSGSPSVVSPLSVSPAVGWNEVEVALKTHDYDKATDALLALQTQKGLSEQQAAAVQSQMQKLQSNLADAIANGDAKAKAAADKLRRASLAR